ncbi:MAG: WG repeat-containing protein [Bacteroidota bacterium]
MVPCIYDQPINYSSYGYARVITNGKEGLVDTSGKLIIPCKYNKISSLGLNDFDPHSKSVQVELNKKFGRIGYDGKVRIAPVYDHIENVSWDYIFVIKGRLRAIMDHNGNYVVPPKYRSIRPQVFGDYFIVTDSTGKQGVVNSKAKEVVPCIYESIQSVCKNTLFIERNGKMGSVSFSGVQKIPCVYGEIKCGHDGEILVAVDKKWGMVDTFGAIIIPCKYKEVFRVSERVAAVQSDSGWGIYCGTKAVNDEHYTWLTKVSESLIAVEQNKKWGCIDTTGKLIVDFLYSTNARIVEGRIQVSDEPIKYVTSQGWPYRGEGTDKEYASVGLFSEGMAKVTDRQGYCGYINKDSKEIVSCNYDAGGEFSNGIVGVKKDGKWRFINKEGITITHFEFDEIGNFNEGIACVLSDKKYGFIDTTGKNVVSFIYNEAYSFYHGTARVRLNENWGLIDKDGHVVYDFIYDEPWVFYNGLAAVSINDKMIYIDTAGRKAIKDSFAFCSEFTGRRAKVLQDDWGKYGYIDMAGKLVIPCLYNDASLFQFGLAAVSKTIRSRYDRVTKYGVIDTNGRTIVPFEYKEISNYVDPGYAIATDYRLFAFIDTNAKFVTPFIYEDVGENFKEGLMRVKKNGKWGYLNERCKTAIPFKYDEAQNFSEGLAAVKINGHWSYIDHSGKEVLKFK